MFTEHPYFAPFILFVAVLIEGVAFLNQLPMYCVCRKGLPHKNQPLRFFILLVLLVIYHLGEPYIGYRELLHLDELGVPTWDWHKLKYFAYITFVIEGSALIYKIVKFIKDLI